MPVTSSVTSHQPAFHRLRETKRRRSVNPVSAICEVLRAKRMHDQDQPRSPLSNPLVTTVRRQITVHRERRTRSQPDTRKTTGSCTRNRYGRNGVPNLSHTTRSAVMEHMCRISGKQTPEHNVICSTTSLGVSRPRCQLNRRALGCTYATDPQPLLAGPRAAMEGIANPGYQSPCLSNCQSAWQSPPPEPKAFISIKCQCTNVLEFPTRHRRHLRNGLQLHRRSEAIDEGEPLIRREESRCGAYPGRTDSGGAAASGEHSA